MAAEAFLLLACYMAVLLVLAKPLGDYMTGLVQDRALPGTRGFENLIYRVCGASSDEMNWRQYLFAILFVNGTGIVFLFLVLFFQGRCRLIRKIYPASPGIWRSTQLSAL